MDEKNNLRNNGSGYSDPTAYQAIKQIEEDKKQKKGIKDSERFRRLLDVIFNVCELSGFHLESRIVVKDKKSGKIWR